MRIVFTGLPSVLTLPHAPNVSNPSSTCWEALVSENYETVSVCLYLCICFLLQHKRPNLQLHTYMQGNRCNTELHTNPPLKICMHLTLSLSCSGFTLMNILKINIYSLCVCLSQVNLQALVLPFYLEGAWDWTQIIRLGGEWFYLWSGLPDSLVSVCASFALNDH